MRSIFTIATYNIEFAQNREKIVENMQKMAKDGVNIFCLQEIINIPNETFIVKHIVDKLGKEWQAAYHVGEENSRLSIGTCIIWSTTVFQLQSTEKILLPKIKKFDLHEKLYYKIVGAQGIPLQRKAISCYFTFQKVPLRVTSVHLDNVGGPRHRAKQLSYLLSKHKEKDSKNYEIVCGDFNTFDLLKSGYEKKLLQRKFGNQFVDASDKVGWTSDIHRIDLSKSIRLFSWFIETFNIHIKRRLDYIWVKNFEVMTCQKLDIPGSDHLPVIAKLLIKA